MRIATIASALALVLVTQTGCALPFDDGSTSRSDDATASPSVGRRGSSSGGGSWSGVGYGDALGGAVLGSLAVAGDGSGDGIDTGNSGSTDDGVDNGDSGSTDDGDDGSCVDDGSDGGDASDGSDSSDGTDDGSWDTGDDGSDDGSDGSDDSCDDCLVHHAKPTKKVQRAHACKKGVKRAPSKISAAGI